MRSKEVQVILVRALLVLALGLLGYLLSPFWGNLLWKMGFIVVNRIFHQVFWKIGFSFALGLGIAFFLEDSVFMVPSGTEGSVRGRLSDLFNSDRSSSEASVNNQQEAPPVPAPVQQAWVPEHPENPHLISAQQRMEELSHRLALNSMQKNLTRENWGSIIAAQITVEERIESTLLEDGYSAQSLLENRHKIRGFLFYPRGTSLSERTYVGYVRTVDSDIRASIPFRRVKEAIDNYELNI